MKKLIDFFTNRIVISIIGLIAISILIWFAGPHIKFGENNAAPLGGTVARLICIIIILLIWGLNNFRVQMQNNKQNKELVDDLQDNQAQAGQDAASDQTAEELHQMNQRFTDALATLKRLKFKGRGKNKALYELPWYIIIGPPGSGKTTALVNSSLDFPLAEQFGKSALQGVGGTRNCDWWFTNDAVLIDTAGRYTTQDSHRVVDSSAWEGFLSLLKRNRRRRPINGAIIAISLHDLLIQTDEERVMHAKTIRTRIDELMEKLEIRFPIYLMFTKSDLVSGFSEFFEDLSKEEREQVWGVSLPNAPAASQSPDFEFLDTEFHKLLERIYDRVLWRVHQERDLKRRGAIQGFPSQMENLKSVIDSFVKQTFVKNRYQFQPYLRGVYFTSGTQDGTPIDRLMTSVAANFGFERDIAQLPHQQGKSFFLGRLFKEVIFPESELVGSNRKYETIIRWAQRGAFVGLAALTVGCMAVWAGSFTRHKMYMSEVETYIAEFNAEKKRVNKWNKDVRTVLPTLNPLAKASIVYDQEEHPWLSGLGMYDGNVDASADRVYAAQLKELFLPRLIHYLEVYLKQGNQGSDLYNTFRVYLMFSKTEHMNPDLIRDWFIVNWNQKLHGEASRRKELEAHLNALLSLELEPVQLNKRLISQTRTALLRVPVSKRIYSRIRNNPVYAQPVNMLNQFGETVRDAYKMSPATEKALMVPAMFTIEGYENIDFSTESPVIADIVNDEWVLSDDKTARVSFAEEDLGEISEQVKDHYLSEYAQVWTEAVTSLEIAEFTSLRQISEILASFTDPVYSPLLSILQIIKTNTQMTSPVAGELAEKAASGESSSPFADALKKQAAGRLGSAFDGNKVDKRFKQLNALLRESANKPPPVSSIQQRIQQLQDFVAEVSISPDPSKKAFEIASARYRSGAGNPITALYAYAKTTSVPEPVKSWLISLSDETWKVMLGAAYQYVNAEWKSQVYAPCSQALAGRYPINSSSRDDLAMFDFSEFFKPEGTLDKFYTGFISPFIDTRSGWGNRAVDGRSLGLSSQTLKQVQRAQLIKKVFFRSNPAIPSLNFELKPQRMTQHDASFTLEVGDNRISYRHGPKFPKTIRWSGADENTRVRLIFNDINDVIHSKQFEGPWAWFRLQDRAQLKKTRRSNVYLVTYTVSENIGGGRKKNHSITYEINAKSVNNPFSKNLLGAFKCSPSI